MNIPNGYNPFSCTDFAIIGDGITDYIQQNNTRVHRPLKHEYRDLEAKSLLSVLQKGR